MSLRLNIGMHIVLACLSFCNSWILSETLILLITSTMSATAFIVHMSIPYGKTFPWLWIPWSLTYFLKTLTCKDGSLHTYMPGTKVMLPDLGVTVSEYMRYACSFGLGELFWSNSVSCCRCRCGLSSSPKTQQAFPLNFRSVSPSVRFFFILVITTLL